MVAKERHVLGDGRLGSPGVLFRARYGNLRRELRVAPLFHGEKGAGARELALHERDLVLPGVRNELHVLQVPVVVSDPDARRSRLRRRLRIEPGGEVVRRRLRAQRAVTSAARRLRGRVELRRERGEIGALLADALRSVRPEIPAVARQIRLRLARAGRGSRGGPRRASPPRRASAGTGTSRARRRRPRTGPRARADRSPRRRP